MSFPAVGFETQTIIGGGDYTSYDVYGFDQYQLTMSIRIKALTDISPTIEDVNWALSAIRDNNFTLEDQNVLISNYMNDKYSVTV